MDFPGKSEKKKNTIKRNPDDPRNFRYKNSPIKHSNDDIITNYIDKTTKKELTIKCHTCQLRDIPISTDKYSCNDGHSYYRFCSYICYNKHVRNHLKGKKCHINSCNEESDGNKGIYIYDEYLYFCNYSHYYRYLDEIGTSHQKYTYCMKCITKIERTESMPHLCNKCSEICIRCSNKLIKKPLICYGCALLFNIGGMCEDCYEVHACQIHPISNCRYCNRRGILPHIFRKDFGNFCSQWCSNEYYDARIRDKNNIKSLYNFKVCTTLDCNKPAIGEHTCACKKSYCSNEHLRQSKDRSPCSVCQCIHSDGCYSEGEYISHYFCSFSHLVSQKCSTRTFFDKCKFCAPGIFSKDLCYEPKCKNMPTYVCTCGVKLCPEHNFHPRKCNGCQCFHKKVYRCCKPRCNQYVCQSCSDTYHSCFSCYNELAKEAERHKLGEENRKKLEDQKQESIIKLCSMDGCKNPFILTKTCSCNKQLLVCSELCYNKKLLSSCHSCRCIHKETVFCDMKKHCLCIDCKICIRCEEKKKKKEMGDEHNKNQKEDINDIIKQNNRKECVLCLDQPNTYIIYRCGHKCVCETCANILLKEEKSKKLCPLCKREIVDIIKAYDP